jgi:hypothetical protein
MKTTLKSKTTLLSIIVAMALTLGIYSCKKDAAISTTDITEADAAELSTDAIVPLNAGLVSQVNSSVSAYKATAFSCGVQKDSTIVGASATGATPSYNYLLKWSYILSCNGLVPNQLALNFTGSSSYSGTLMSSNDNSTGEFVLTGLPASSSAYTLNTTYVRNGSQTSKIGRNATFTSKFTITSSNITVDKTTLLILSGSATVSLTGSSSNGSSFSYGGTVTFLGANKAKLVLNSGVVYNIQW